MVTLAVIGAANFVIGGLIGMTGIAGFLLPLLYAGYLHMGVTESLALSFFAFLISGAIGAWNYEKEGNMDVPFGLRLGAGSFAGAAAGVFLNAMIPEQTVKTLLYLVVLLSGLSILLRKDKVDSERKQNRLEKKTGAIVLLGFLTGAVCSLSGAGGPVLVMPLLVLAGVPVRTAVGVSLFDSVFIALPAGAGYVWQSDWRALLPALLTAGICHGVGVQVGSKNAGRIPQKLLKKGIAVFSVLIAIWKLCF